MLRAPAEFAQVSTETTTEVSTETTTEVSTEATTTEWDWHQWFCQHEADACELDCHYTDSMCIAECRAMCS